MKLSQPANVSAVSYEHLSAKLNPDGTISSAPKNFQIWVGTHQFLNTDMLEILLDCSK